MRLREYRTNTHHDGVRRGGDRSAGARGDVLASQVALPMLGDLPSNGNPRFLFEDFNGDRFIAEPVEPYVNQATDIIEAFEKAWFGERTARSHVSNGPTTLPRRLPTSNRRRLFRQQQQEQQASLAPPLIATTTASASPPEQSNSTLNQQQTQLKNGFSWNNQTQTMSSPIAASVTPEQQRQAQILQELPGIGTWAGRQRLFSVRPLPQVPNSQIEDEMLALEASSESLKDHAAVLNDSSTAPQAAATENGHELESNRTAADGYDGEEDTLSDMVEPRQRRRNGYTSKHEGDGIEDVKNDTNGVVDGDEDDDTNINAIDAATLPATRNTTLQRSTSNTSSEARHISAAWKWRFTRKWEAEQRRVLEADPAVIAAEDGDGAGDDLDALEYLHACGMGLDLQMLAGDVQQHQQRRRRKARGRGRGGAGGGGRGGTTNNTNINGVSTTIVNNNNGALAPPPPPPPPAYGRIKSGIINAPQPSRPSETGLLTSLRRDASSVSTAATMQFEVEPSYASIGDLLSCEGSENLTSYLLTPPDTGERGGGGGLSHPAAATRDLLSVAVRGRELLQRQTEFEQEAAAKWEEIERNCCGGATTWAGNVIPPVDIAMHGKFYFVVLRLCEVGAVANFGGGGGGSGSGSGSSAGNNTNGVNMNRSGSIGTNRQRMLVRGRPKATPQELLEETIAQAATACAQRMLPYVSITLVGAGEMEWREDTDRHLMVSPAPKYMNMKTRSQSTSRGGSGSPPDVVLCGDVCALAASLLHQALPLHFSISTRAQSLASHGNGTLL